MGFPLTLFRTESCCSPPPKPRVIPAGVGDRDRTSQTHPSPAWLLPFLLCPALPTHQPALGRGSLQRKKEPLPNSPQTCCAPDSLGIYPVPFLSLPPSTAVERLRPGSSTLPSALLQALCGFQTTRSPTLTHPCTLISPVPSSSTLCSNHWASCHSLPLPISFPPLVLE